MEWDEIMAFVLAALAGGLLAWGIAGWLRESEIAAIANGEKKAIRIVTPDGPKYYVVDVEGKGGDAP